MYSDVSQAPAYIPSGIHDPLFEGFQFSPDPTNPGYFFDNALFGLDGSNLQDPSSPSIAPFALDTSSSFIPFATTDPLQPINTMEQGSVFSQSPCSAQ